MIYDGGWLGERGGNLCGFCRLEMGSCIYVHKGPTTRSLRYGRRIHYEQHT
jgi:hypothetical protein